MSERPTQCSNCGLWGKAGAIQYAERGGYDFFGHTATGVHIGIECKDIDKPSLRLWVEEGAGVKVHQMIALREVAKAGGIALIVWKRRDLVTMLDPMPYAPHLGIKSVSIDDLRWHPIGVLCDRLEVLILGASSAH